MGELDAALAQVRLELAEVRAAIARAGERQHAPVRELSAEMCKLDDGTAELERENALADERLNGLRRDIEKLRAEVERAKAG